MPKPIHKDLLLYGEDGWPECVIGGCRDDAIQFGICKLWHDGKYEMRWKSLPCCLEAGHSGSCVAEFITQPSEPPQSLTTN